MGTERLSTGHTAGICRETMAEIPADSVAGNFR
jgi:hypothetical protein